MRHSPTHEEFHDKTAAARSRRGSHAATDTSPRHRFAAIPPVPAQGNGPRHAAGRHAARGRVESALPTQPRGYAPLHRAPVTRVTVRRIGQPGLASASTLARRILAGSRPVVRVFAGAGLAVRRLTRTVPRPVGRFAIAAAAVGAIAISASGHAASAANPALAAQFAPMPATATRPSADEASRSADRTMVTVPADALAAAQAVVAQSDLQAATEAKAKAKADADAKAAAQAQAAAAAQAAQAKAQADAAAAAKFKADNPTPVAGLSQLQMNNAMRIVNEGKALGLPARAYVLAVACAMQESQLLNLASDVLPESYQYPHEGAGSDHDSIGLFQQRPSSGWGTVKDIMTPAYAAKAFYDVLVTIPGWQSMALTYAIQAVQVSAYPDAYAPHEWAAQTVVNALA
jgi:hypothetical protein